MKTVITQQLIRSLSNEQQNSKVFQVDLSNRLLTAMPSLKPFHKLRCLQLSFNSIERIQNLQHLPDLRELHLSNNQMAKIENLQGNKMLTVLDLANNKINKIENIGHLIKLQKLSIENNRLEKISGMQGLKDLKKLNISGNRLTSIDSLPVFSKLESLDAENNLITKIPIKIFANSVSSNNKSTNKLVKVNLAKNKLTQISFLSALPNLQWLNISQNRLEKFTFTETTIFRNLQFLDISQNRIEQLPEIKKTFPQLTIFYFANNFIQAEYQLIRAFAEADSLIEIDFRNNPMQSKQFEQTAYRVYNFDRINGRDFNNTGARYYKQANHIKQELLTGVWADIEDDEQDRKTKMSGFYNEELETEITGMKPNRPSSPLGKKSKAVMKLNYEDFEKAYHDIKNNDQKIDFLRKQCIDIFKRNGIVPPEPVPYIEQEESKKEQTNNSESLTSSQSKEQGLITQVGPLNESAQNNRTVNQFKKKNQEHAKRWKELKNKQKSFNIRGVVRKMSGSQRKSGMNERQGSSSRITNQGSRQLMRTQLNPPRWNNDPALSKTLAYRPLSAKKKVT